MDGTVKVEGLTKSFGTLSLMERWGRAPDTLKNISFNLEKGELAALVGESGSGKTTLGRCLLGLVKFQKGTVVVNGSDVGKLERSKEKKFRMSAQMVFQNPYASLDPAFRAKDALLEAIYVHHGKIPKEEALAEVERLAALVQLPAERLNEFPPQLSGGEKRRVVFARSLATNPSFMVMDEPVSGLDQPIQAQLLDLLRRIHQKHSTTMLFISHDLKLVRFIATRVIVMHHGRIVEDAPSAVFFGRGPKHPYSRELLDSAFKEGLGEEAGQPSPPPKAANGGCTFLSRCRHARRVDGAPCGDALPTLDFVGENHRVACFQPLKDAP